MGGDTNLDGTRPFVYKLVNTDLKHFIIPKWTVGHDNSIVEFIQGPPTLSRLIIVAEFDEGSTLLMKEQGIIGSEDGRGG